MGSGGLSGLQRIGDGSGMEETMQFHRMKKLDIIIESAQRERLIEIIKESGATGYTIYGNVDGEGMRESREDIGFDHTHKNVGVFVIGPEGLIMELVQRISEAFPNYAGIVFLGDVQVLRKGLFQKRVLERVVKIFKGKEAP